MSIHEGALVSKKRNTLRTRCLLVFSAAMIAGALVDMLLSPAPAVAVAREIIELQDSVGQLSLDQQAMQTAIAQERGVERTLIEESLDAVKNLDIDMATLQKSAQDSSGASGSRLDTIGTQLESIADNFADLDARLGKFDQKLADVLTMLQNVDSKRAPRPSKQIR